MQIKEIFKNNPFLSKYYYNLLYARVARYQRFLAHQVLAMLLELKGRYQGKRCFIIGTGPSLTISDLELLSNEVTFGTNRIYELFDKTSWRPTFYINQDYDLIRSYPERIKAVRSEISFLPIEFVEVFPGEKYRFFVLKHKVFYPHSAPFSFDISKYVNQGFSVVYGAIQIAAYMGFSEIYLLGVDHNYALSQDAKGHQVRTSNSKHNYSQGMKEYSNLKNLPRVQESTLAFETAEKVSRKKGFRIFNVTRGGKLECFERCDLDEVINKNC